jgi:hypothetical protein
VHRQHADWHTRLVTELWRISGDTLFYATAVRWRGYQSLFRAQQATASPAAFLRPVFDVKDSPGDDAAIMEALGSRDPAQMSPEAAADALKSWAAQRGLGKARTTALLGRMGHPASLE